MPNEWKRRAGSRFFYVCEDGLVHYCSQQRGYPAKPLAEYTTDDIRREYLTVKGCAPHCTVSCVHQVSYMDFWRSPQTIQSEPAKVEVLVLVLFVLLFCSFFFFSFFFFCRCVF